MQGGERPPFPFYLYFFIYATLLYTLLILCSINDENGEEVMGFPIFLPVFVTVLKKKRLESQKGTQNLLTKGNEEALAMALLALKRQLIA